MTTRQLLRLYAEAALLGFTLGVLTLLIWGLTPAHAHTPTDLNQWVNEWTTNTYAIIETATHAELQTQTDLLTSMMKRHPCYFNPCTVTVKSTWTPGVYLGVEQWRPLVTAYFPAADVEWALAIMACESGGNPNAVGPTNDHGLYQHLAQYWTDRSTRAGWPEANIYDPEANIAVAAWLLKTGGKTHWVCKA